MSTRPVLRYFESETRHEPPQSERRYRLEPEMVSQLARAAADRQEAGSWRAPRARMSGLIVQLVATLRLWRERAESRRDLASCDPRLLRDIGVSPIDAGREIGKPFWR